MYPGSEWLTGWGVGCLCFDDQMRKSDSLRWLWIPRGTFKKICSSYLFRGILWVTSNNFFINIDSSRNMSPLHRHFNFKDTVPLSEKKYEKLCSYFLDEKRGCGKVSWCLYLRNDSHCSYKWFLRLSNCSQRFVQMIWLIFNTHQSFRRLKFSYLVGKVTCMCRKLWERGF